MFFTYLSNSCSCGPLSSGVFSQLMKAARRHTVDNMLKNLLIVVNYHVSCIESKVSVRIIEDELKCMLAAFEAVL